MLIVQLTGGLGNQLFQYAFGRALSERSKATLMLDIHSYAWDTLRKYELGVFNISAQYATKEEIEKIKQSNPLFKDRLINKLKRTPLPYFQLSYLKEQSFTFDLNYLNFKSNNVYLEGYWQSENYFKEIRAILLKEILIEDSSFSSVFIKYKSIIRQAPNSVSVHIRRGDYVSNTETTAFHGLCGLDYYRDAMDHIESSICNPTYFVFSDDKAYVKQVFSGKQHIIIVENIPYDYEELFLMSYCSHHIIANSSFSWWGAWLNDFANKQVIAPEKWFATIEMNNQTESLIPKSWIRK
jgi:hypothetical protein